MNIVVETSYDPGNCCSEKKGLHESSVGLMWPQPPNMVFDQVDNPVAPIQSNKLFLLLDFNPVRTFYSM